MGQPGAFLRSSSSEFTFGSHTLLVAIDETGHEELADPRYQVFGLGGCVTTVAEYSTAIAAPWSALKNRHFSGARTPLHATGLRANAEQAGAIGDFFRGQVFGRFAAVSTPATSLGTPLGRYESTALLMTRCLTEAAIEYDFNSVAVIFEHSQRTDPLVRKVFSPQTDHLSDVANRWRVPTQFYLASKAAAEPLVEVADFIVQAAGTAVSRNITTGAAFLNRRDFASVFEGGRSRRAAFIRLDELGSPEP